MALQSKLDDLLTAWRALTAQDDAEGWRTIAVAVDDSIRVLAGRRYPEDEEALLFGFSSIHVPPADRLPHGRGFTVTRIDIGNAGADRVWIALTRQPAGSLELFAMVAHDIISTLSALRDNDDERLFHAFLARIWAWQEFMKKGNEGILGPEAEVGLFGELELLRYVIEQGIDRSTAVAAWMGPLGGLQDYSFGTGAIEVKSTVSVAGFPATITSLEQLDDSLISPIYLMGIKLALEESGRTLPEQITDLRNSLLTDASARVMFDSRMLHAGYMESAAPHYKRRFSLSEARMFVINGTFPRLTRHNVPDAVRGARYEIDLDLVVSDSIHLTDALKNLGVVY